MVRNITCQQRIKILSIESQKVDIPIVAPVSAKIDKTENKLIENSISKKEENTQVKVEKMPAKPVIANKSLSPRFEEKPQSKVVEDKPQKMADIPPKLPEKDSQKMHAQVEEAKTIEKSVELQKKVDEKPIKESQPAKIEKKKSEKEAPNPIDYQPVVFNTESVQEPMSPYGKQSEKNAATVDLKEKVVEEVKARIQPSTLPNHPVANDVSFLLS